MAGSANFYLYDHAKKCFYELFDGFLCGRQEGNLQLESDDLLSKRHCQFTIQKHDVFLEDLFSTNKTKVNSLPLTPGKRRRIHLNDVVEFGVQRMILTNQREHAPGSIEEARKNTLQYKAFRRSDGSLTFDLLEGITRRTQILLSRQQFFRLRAKKEIRRSDFTTWILSGAISLLWIYWLWLLQGSGALEDGLRHSPLALLLQFPLLALGASVPVIWFHSFLVTRVLGPLYLRLPMLVLSMGLFVGLWAALESGLDLAGKADENLTYLHCVKSMSPSTCHVLARDDLSGFRRLPEEIRENIRQSLLVNQK